MGGCFLNFCENVAECVHCPCSLVPGYNNKVQMEVCTKKGMCRLGTMFRSARGGVGFCDCRGGGAKGYLCNQ